MKTLKQCLDDLDKMSNFFTDEEAIAEFGEENFETLKTKGFVVQSITLVPRRYGWKKGDCANSFKEIEREPTDEEKIIGGILGRSGV